LPNPTVLTFVPANWGSGDFPTKKDNNICRHRHPCFVEPQYI
jgi:hypothetical protein